MTIYRGKAKGVPRKFRVKNIAKRARRKARLGIVPEADAPMSTCIPANTHRNQFMMAPTNNSNPNVDWELKKGEVKCQNPLT